MNPTHALAPTGARHKPQSLSDLFFSFSTLALQGFGGVLAIVQRELVEKKQWLTNEEFLEDCAVAQVLPGPNVVNLALMIGDRYFGWRGAAVAVAGMLCFPCLIVLTLALLYASYSDHALVAGALRGMGAAAAGMVGATALKLSASLRTHVFGTVGCWLAVGMSFLLVVWLRWPLWHVLLIMGVVCCALAWRELP